MSDLTLSIVSHGHGAMLVHLLADLDACPSLEGTNVIVTLNLPGEAAPAGTYRRIRVEPFSNPGPCGFGANHNAAFQHCRTRWFAVLNPDLRLRGDPFPALLQHAGRVPCTGVVAPRIINSQGRPEDSVRRQPTLWSVAARVISQRFGQASLASSGATAAAAAEGPGDFYWLAGMFLLFRADAYRQVGGFDERFFLYCEDYDICARLHLAGFAVTVTDQAQAVHDAQRTSRRSARYLRWHVSSLLRVWTSRVFWAVSLRRRVPKAE